MLRVFTLSHPCGQSRLSAPPAACHLFASPPEALWARKGATSLGLCSDHNVTGVHCQRRRAAAVVQQEGGATFARFRAKLELVDDTERHRLRPWQGR